MGTPIQRDESSKTVQASRSGAQYRGQRTYHHPPDPPVTQALTSNEIDEQIRQMQKQMADMHTQMQSQMSANMASIRDEMRLHSTPGGAIHTMHDMGPALPIAVGGETSSRLQWKFNVDGFQPDDISVKTHGRFIDVIAKHSEKSTNQQSLKELSRSCTVPDGCDLAQMTSKLTDRGVLVIEVPYRPPELQHRVIKEIPIKHEAAPSSGSLAGSKK